MRSGMTPRCSAEGQPVLLVELVLQELRRRILVLRLLEHHHRVRPEGIVVGDAGIGHRQLGHAVREIGRLLFQHGREPGSRLQHGQLTGDEERLEVAIAVGVGRIGLGCLVGYREVDQELRGPDPDLAVEEGFAVLAVTAGPARTDEGVFETVAAAGSLSIPIP